MRRCGTLTASFCISKKSSENQEKMEVDHMKRTKLRMVSAALAACMMASVLPLGAMAQGGG